jgi:RNA polymerase sigma factor (sigma-70 family)
MGDHERFERLYLPLRQAFLTHARCLAHGDIHVAEDVLQRSVIHAMQHFPKLRDEGYFKNWMLKIITQRHIEHLRQASKRRSVSIDDVEAHVLAPDLYAERLHDAETAAHVEALRRHLGDADLQLLLSHFGHRVSCQQIANEQGRTLPAVKSAMFRLMSRARQFAGSVVSA